MTHALPIPSPPRPVRLLPMQFAAPLRTAESYGIEPFDEAGPIGRAAHSDRVSGRAHPVGWGLAVAGALLAWGGLVLWSAA